MNARFIVDRTGVVTDSIDWRIQFREDLDKWVREVGLPWALSLDGGTPGWWHVP